MDRGVITTAEELFAGRHYPSVVAMCNDALEDEPGCVELLVVRARAHIKLRRDLDAQADLRDIIRLSPSCGLAYRLLGELAARRDENESAGIFFREALRLSPEDVEAAEWLQIVETTLRPARHVPRFARGTRTPDAPGDERPTKPFARGSDHDGAQWKTPAPVAIERTLDLLFAESDAPAPLATQEAKRFEVPVLPRPSAVPPPLPTMPPRAPVAPAMRRPVPPPRSSRSPLNTTSSMPELPGFGDYLVTTGILSRERLRAAQAYQRSMKVQLSTAIVTLGLATPQRIEWASVAHQSQQRRPA